MASEACELIVSALAALEPMAGGALAINLAYLNLDRFRYRSAIRKTARDNLERLSPARPNIRESKWFKEVERLAALPDNKDSKTKDCKMPDGFWGAVYTLIFEKHQDRVASHVMTALALFVLFFGTAATVNHATWVSCWFEGWAGVLMLYLLLLSIALPIVFVFGGGRVVAWACKYATDNVKELEKMMQGEVASVDPPNIAPQAQVHPIGA